MRNPNSRPRVSNPYLAATRMLEIDPRQEIADALAFALCFDGRKPRARRRWQKRTTTKSALRAPGGLVPRLIGDLRRTTPQTTRLRFRRHQSGAQLCDASYVDPTRLDLVRALARRSAFGPRADSQGLATLAIWRATQRPWLTTFAPIYMAA